MAKEKKDFDVLNNEVNMSIYADHLALTPDFIRQNTKELERIEDRVTKSLKNLNEDDPTLIFDTMQQLQDVTRATFLTDSYNTTLGQPLSGGMYGNATTRNDFRMIYGETENKDDAELFNFHASIFSVYRNLVSEYRGIARLIPEINRCASMKARDILAINEITKNAISNVYVPSDVNITNNDPADLTKNPINKIINEKILEKYEVEDKLPRYLKTALIEGAKPVVIYPFKDIIDMAKYNVNLYSKKFNDFNKHMDKAKSEEAFDDLVYKCHKKKQSIIPDMYDNKWHIFSTEDGNLEFNEVNYKKFRDMVINKFLSKEDLDEYYIRGMEDINDSISKAENSELMDIYGSNVINKEEKIKETKVKFRDFYSKVKADGDLGEHFKDQIFNAIKHIDANVEFYDQSEIAMGMAINNFRRLLQYSAYHEDPKSGLIGYGAKLQKNSKLVESNPYMDQDPINKFSDGKKHGFTSVLDEFSTDFETNKTSILNDCLIKEYDAEDIIPIIIAGKHIDYYAIETAPYTGNLESVNKRNSNFTDMFLNLGINNDAAISPGLSNGMSGGVQNIPIGGVGPMTDTSVPGITSGLGSMSLMGGLDTMGFFGDTAIRRNNIMKKIIFNVLSQKLRRKDIEDDETFTNTIMALIRDGAIVQNRVKIIYIPEKYMCYFTPGLDGNGIPQSFMKNTLFTCYEKLLVNMNNIMTRLTRTGTKDKITINIGKAKNMGYSIRAIENELTTRRLNVESPFTSLSRVLKSAALSETVIVPVFDGEKLFEYEEIQRNNNYQPDDELEQRLTNDIVSGLECPINITNPYQEIDYASVAASRNIEYRADIIKLQKIFSKITEKFIKLLIVGSGLYENIKKTNDKFSLKEIHVTFSPPEELNMKSANDSFGTVSSYVDNIINIVINPNDDSKTIEKQRFLFKQKLYQELMPGVGFDKYITMAEKLLPLAMNAAIDDRVDNSVNDQIVNTSFSPLVATPDGKIVEGNDGDKGIGNSDNEGW